MTRAAASDLGLRLGALDRRSFGAAEQEMFAAFSGDRNPIHMDAVAARRTQAGSPIVHGMHVLLWCLEGLADTYPDLPPVSALQASFEHLTFVGDTVEASVVEASNLGPRLAASVDGTVVMLLGLTFGSPAPASDAPRPATPRLAVPRTLTFEEAATLSGVVAHAEAARAAELFPSATRLLGAERVRGMADMSYLVGMICPGMHSIFGGLKLAVGEPASATELAFRVAFADPRFRVIELEVEGAGWSGRLETFVRSPPTGQAAAAGLADRVAPGEFEAITALVVGGSRGLGELTAKMLAAGGAAVTITYAQGRQDAERVCDEIAAAGGRCRIIPYDVRLPPERQLAAAEAPFDTLFYFATPPIFSRRADRFSKSRFDEFVAFYITGFEAICGLLAERASGMVSAFYPSSVAVTKRPKNMTEYAMAKAAGEILCADLQAAPSRLRISVARLPRLPTDQTASLMEVDTDDPIDHLLPLVKRVCRAADPAGASPGHTSRGS